MTLPQRPRLGRHVAARRHVVDGVTSVVVVDQRSGHLARLGEREWAVAAAMDGTRPVEGLVIAAARHGAVTTEEQVATLVAELDAAGFLETSAPPRLLDADQAPEPQVPGDRPLEVLPDYTFDCDGRGGCCRVYPTVVFLPVDVARARAALPMVHDGGDDEAAAFTPVSGAVDAASSAAVVDGRCAYLAPDGRCGVHAALGAHAKPFGCRTYPLAFVDDGTSVRVVPRPECSCVPRSAAAGAPAGDPLLPRDVITRADLPPVAFVHRVPEWVALGRPRSAGGTPAGAPRGTRAPRSALAAWSRTLATVTTPDAAAAFAALADVVPAGLDDARDTHLVAAPPPLDPERSHAWITALRGAAARKAREGWRSSRDLAHQGFLAVETACDLALAAPATFAAGPRDAREQGAEALHLRAVLFGHLMFLGDEEVVLADALEARSAMVVTARALGLVAELTELPDPAFSWPLSLLEGLVRGHGL